MVIKQLQLRPLVYGCVGHEPWVGDLCWQAPGDRVSAPLGPLAISEWVGDGGYRGVPQRANRGGCEGRDGGEVVVGYHILTAALTKDHGAREPLGAPLSALHP